MSFLDVILRGVALSGQALALGGVAFLLVVVRGERDGGADDAMPVRPTLWLTALGAGAVVLAHGVAVLLELSALAEGGRWPLHETLATTYGGANVVRAIGCVLVIAATRLAAPSVRNGVLALGGVLTAAGSATVSHAVAEMEGRAPLVAFTAVHQVAAEVWLGGLVHLLAIAAAAAGVFSITILRRFSTLALTSVSLLVASGLGLAVVYVGSPAALLGTAYGLMVATKGIVLVGLVALGAANYRSVRRLGTSGWGRAPRLRRLLEVEIGLGVTVLMVAASLTSTPPARDVVLDRARLDEVAAIFTPRWPSLVSPTHEALAASTTLGDAAQPRTPEDTAWSEYNHHVAGAVVLTIAVLALVARTRWGTWARHWPLLLLGLAAFMFVRDDPEAWPLGPLGFWESMTAGEVVQHRLFVVVVAGFGIFEWMVRTQRVGDARWALVFPLLCAAGATLLLTHTHAVINVKSGFLMEVTHTPIALLGLTTGWARWLELRLPDGGAGIPERVWSLALGAVGVLLLLYREV